MAQLKTIPEDAELVIFDLYNTLTAGNIFSGDRWKVREKTEQVLQYIHYVERKVALASDGAEHSLVAKKDEQAIMDVLKGYLHYFKTDYNFGDPVHKEPDISDKQTLLKYLNSTNIYGKTRPGFLIEEKEGQSTKKYKNLGKICEDLKVHPSKAVFITDNSNGVDKMSAERFGIDYIIVPPGTTDPNFDMFSLVSNLKKQKL